MEIYCICAELPRWNLGLRTMKAKVRSSDVGEAAYRQSPRPPSPRHRILLARETKGVAALVCPLTLGFAVA